MRLVPVYISYVAKVSLITAVFSQLLIACHPIQMAGVETVWELHTYPCYKLFAIITLMMLS